MVLKTRRILRLRSRRPAPWGAPCPLPLLPSSFFSVLFPFSHHQSSAPHRHRHRRGGRPIHAPQMRQVRRRSPRHQRGNQAQPAPPPESSLVVQFMLSTDTEEADTDTRTCIKHGRNLGRGRGCDFISVFLGKRVGRYAKIPWGYGGICGFFWGCFRGFRFYQVQFPFFSTYL